MQRENDGLRIRGNDGLRFIKLMEGGRLKDGRLGVLDPDDDWRANKGLDATLVRPLAVLDFTELKIDQAGEGLDARGFNEKRGRGRGRSSRLGSSPKSTKKPMSLSGEFSESSLIASNVLLLGCCCGCVDGRLLRDDSRENEGRRNKRGPAIESNSDRHSGGS